MNAKELAKKLNTSHRIVSALLKSGRIKATKEKRVWKVDENSAAAFIGTNRYKVERLQADYVTMYWNGLSPKRLQKHVKKDFESNGIIYPAAGFAEKAIYQSVMSDRK